MIHFDVRKQGSRGRGVTIASFANEADANVVAAELGGDHKVVPVTINVLTLDEYRQRKVAQDSVKELLAAHEFPEKVKKLLQKHLDL